MKYLAYLAGSGLLVCAVLALVFLDMSVRPCLDHVSLGARVPCVQPVETLGDVLGRNVFAIAPAALGVVLIVGACVSSRRRHRR